MVEQSPLTAHTEVSTPTTNDPQEISDHKQSQQSEQKETFQVEVKRFSSVRHLL
jgi:hypothetical protein